MAWLRGRPIPRFLVLLACLAGLFASVWGGPTSVAAAAESCCGCCSPEAGDNRCRLECCLVPLESTAAPSTDAILPTPGIEFAAPIQLLELPGVLVEDARRILPRVILWPLGHGPPPDLPRGPPVFL